MAEFTIGRWQALVGVGLTLVLGVGSGLPVSAGAAPSTGATASIPDAPAPQPSVALQPQLAEARTALTQLQGAAAIEKADAAARAAEAAGDRVAQAEALLIRARAQGFLGRRADALETLKASEQLWVQVGDGPGRLSALAPQLLLTPDPQRVRELAERVAMLGEREAARPGAAAKELTALGAALFVRRQNEAAVRVFAAAVQIRRRSAPGSLELAETLAPAGQVLVYLHQRALAEEYLREAQEAFEKHAPEAEHFSGVLMWLGILALDRFDLPEARAFLTRALPLSERMRPGHWENGRILTFLGVLAHREGKHQEAAQHHQRATEIYRRIPPAQGDFAVSLLNEGLSARDLRQDDLAIAKLGEARGLMERQQPGGAALALLEEGVGLMLMRKGQLVESERSMRAALAIRERLYPDGIPHAYSLGNLGAVLLRQNRLSEAEAVLARGWRIYLRAAEELSDPQSLVGFSQETHWLAQAYCDVLVRRGRFREALLVAEQARGRGLQRLLAQPPPVSATPPAPTDAAVTTARTARLKAEATLAQRALDLARAELVARRTSVDGKIEGSPEVEAARTAYVQARDAQALARAADARASRRVRPPFVVTEEIADPAALEAALRRLPAGTVYVCFKEQSGDTLLMTADLAPARAGSAPAKVRIECTALPLARGALAPRVERLAQAVTASSGEAVRLGRELFRDLFPGAARNRILTARRLLISPEGSLWKLPFAALVTSAASAPPRYLGLSHPLAFTPSLANAAPVRKVTAVKPGAPRVVLSAGDPVFGTGAPPPANVARLRSFLLLDGAPPPPLPGTRADAEAVARLYGGKPLLGKDATEEAVRARLPQADVVHLATHGYLSPRWALGSGVLLSDPPSAPAGAPRDSRNDGALQAWELMSQVKLKASLVVLAACETGLGETLPGEGLIGLTRALQVAGARSVVTSQWRVRDDATRSLLVRFHQGVRSGLAKDEALRQAMAAVQKQGKWSHPYYWAGFLLTGSPEPL